METKNILQADILDIIFEGRNKNYGAYDLRKSYNKRMIISLACSAACCILLFTAYRIAQSNAPIDHAVFMGPDVVLAEAPKEKEKPAVVTTPPPIKKETVPVRQIKSATPVIVKEAAPDEMPPEQNDIADARIGLVNADGVKDIGINPPPIDGSVKGILSMPQKKAENLDSVFIQVEIESQYPGGVNAWSRFLYRKLSDGYPEEAVEKGIQGRVEVQFIVDVEGNVSDVKALSGPEALREVASRVIRQSGRWIPAEQNGRKVKSYKKQPITFSLGE